MKPMSTSLTAVPFTCFTLAFLLLLRCQYSSSHREQRPDSALTVVEEAEGGGGEGGGGGGGGGGGVADGDDQDANSDLKVVQPTLQWQTLKPDQAVPAGSHVRLNLQTGQREVRLGEEQLKYLTTHDGDGDESQPFLSPDELKRAMKKLKEDVNPDSVASKYRPLEELKREMAQLDLLVETDSQIMRRLLDQFNNSGSTTEQRLNILLELEYLVHQVDNAQTLCSMGGLQFVLDGLNSSDVRLQENSAFVLGSALASNPVVQVKAVESGALQLLLTALATAKPVRVKKKVLFAVAALLRHFPHALRNFLSHGGLQILSELFRADADGVLRARIVTMLYDMIKEKEMMSQTGSDPVLDAAAHEERVRQYSEVLVEAELLEKGWCSLVPQLLETTEHDFREKALRTLLVMASTCVDEYRSNPSLRGSLFSLRDHYQEVVRSEMSLGEDSSYFSEMVELIEAIQIKMK